MADLPIPAGFEEVPDAPAPAAQTTASKLPIPAGFEEVPTAPDQAQIEKYRDFNTYQREVISKMRNGATLADLKAFDKSVGRENTPAHYNDLAQNIAYLKANPGYTPQFSEETPTVGKVALGFIRGVQHTGEGAAQLGTRIAEAGGTLPADASADMQDRLGKFTKGLDEANIQGTPGQLGALGGEIASTAVLPVGEARTAALLTKQGLTQAAKRGATLAASGGAAGAVSQGASETAAEQDSKALLGGAGALVFGPLLEGIVTKIGVPIARKIMDRAATGIGKTLYDASGNLTMAGRVLRTRIQHASEGKLDDQMADMVMQQLVKADPKKLPADKDIGPEMLAQRENVPLTKPMKTRNAKGIQDFESAKTGALDAANGQERALAADKAIDTAIKGNVAGIKGSDASSETAAGALTSKVANAEQAAKDTKNALYDPINKSKERVVQPQRLVEARNKWAQGQGQAAIDALKKVEPSTLALANSLADLGKRPNGFRFGELWGLGKLINEAARKPDASGAIKALRGTVNDLIDNAPPEMFASGNRGVFDQLKRANAANTAYKKAFSAQGKGDVAGPTIENIVALAKNGQATPELVEQAIYGSAKTLDSAGGRKAAANIERLVKAVPSTQQHVKELTINRLLREMSDNADTAALNPTKATSAISNAVEHNKSLLKASGLSEAEIGKLKAQAYLIALKQAPQGARARGSSATNRMIGPNFARAVWRALTAGGPFAGFAAGGVPGAVGVVGVTAAAETARAISTARRVARAVDTGPVKAATPKLKGGPMTPIGARVYLSTIGN